VDVNPLMLEIPETLETQRLSLRIFRAGDSAVGYPAVRETIGELQRWMPWATEEYSEQNFEEWGRRAIADFFNRSVIHYLIFHSDLQEYIGTISAHDIDWKLGKCEIGYWLRTKYTGQGFMTEAAEAIVSLMKRVMPARRIEIRAQTGNQRSRRVAERLGFELEGILRSAMLFKGKAVDMAVYALVQASDQELS
jgi:ribosomal-protein-serine acetyltransferase